MPSCKNCGSKYTVSKDASYGFCRRPLCAKARTQWFKANLDEMPESKFKTKYEDEFWEVTPEQKIQFAYFYSLMRPAKRKIKKRNCLRCRKEIDSKYSSREDHRLCYACHQINIHIGVSAQCTY